MNPQAILHLDRLEFDEAVRIIERRGGFRGEVGTGAARSEEAVSFAAALSASFPMAPVHEIDFVRDGRHVEMSVGFMGLTGPTGVLPRHFDALLMARHNDDDDSIIAFQDIFNHRMISFFHRAWVRSRLPILYERRRVGGRDVLEDPFARALLAASGFATGGLLDAMRVDGDRLAGCAGAFACGRPSVQAIAAVVRDLIGHDVRIEQFSGTWERLSGVDLSILGRQTCVLGRTAVLGDRVWCADGAFRIITDALPLEEYKRVLPGGDLFGVLHDVVRGLVNGQFDVVLCISLRGEDVPTCELNPDDGPRLGLTTFLRSGAAAGADVTVEFGLDMRDRV